MNRMWNKLKAVRTARIVRPLRVASAILCAISLTLAPVGGTLHAGDARLVKIDQGGAGQASRSIVLGLNKAAIVELPVAARDVLVSNPAIVDAVVRTSKRTYLIGLAVGQTNAFFFNESGQQILNLEIRVARDLSGLRDSLRQYFPSARIDVESINDHVVLSGMVASASEASKAQDLAARYIGVDKENVLNMLGIEGKEQVMLKVTVAEMQRSVIKQLGVDLSSAASFGDFALRLATSNAFSVQGQSLGGLSTEGTSYNGDDIGAALRALERDGILRTLAEPNLTAISGESAKFLAGGEFPVPTSRDRDGNVQLEFKPFGVGLNFTPVVLSEGRISLKISTEVSELSSDGAFVLQGSSSTGVTVPGLKVRRAETTLELPSGGSLVMAGLLSDTTRQNIDGVPGAKDMPVLGQLFRSRDYQKNETELVVIVTPYLVDPTSRKNLVLPTDGFAPASDMDTILMGRLNATYGARGATPGDKSLQGPVGFVVD
ncbi:type II and III secretion system protein family protein [Parvibaculum sp.]|uniref:type II and III secretion system protein family protein n=1 Tax=Parvibaculum sp. TaxID=2024848 RepID=UPI0025CE6EC9|nr:type II and III secretion system protein family protein [Parvibaculum sp.]|tara:strand:+ start:12744 stop:14210 length:1467 start_codon:yes stop_codon:yes gene_type:complete